MKKIAMRVNSDRPGSLQDWYVDVVARVHRNAQRSVSGSVYYLEVWTNRMEKKRKRETMEIGRLVSLANQVK